jgi:3-hydroxyisobutyrate dehydrogenase-like beta-hydroxyacid dehydrogenase
MDVFLADLVDTPEEGFESNGHPAFSASATALVDELSTVVAGQKDLRTALEVADATGMQTALADTVVRVWNEAEQKLGAAKDTSVHHTAIDRYLGLLDGD